MLTAHPLSRGGRSVRVESVPDLPDLGSWPTLRGEHAMPMQTHAWMNARRRALRLPHLPLLAIRDDAGIQAIAPFIRVGHWLREFPAMFEPSDLVWGDVGHLQRLVDSLARQSLPIVLDRLPVDSPTLGTVRRAFAGRGAVFVRTAMATPYLDLREYGPDALPLTSGWQSDLRRFARKARALGPLEFDIHAPRDADHLHALLDEAYAIETRSWKFRAGTALTSNLAQGLFFKTFAIGAMQEGHLRIAFLRIGDEPVAMQIASLWRGRFWLYKTSFDAAYAAASPGQLLIRHTLAHAAEAGCKSYEFMGVMADWTRLWTKQTRHYVQVHAMPYSLATVAAATRSMARHARDRMRALTRRGMP